jgi:hypothetical protein
MTVAQSTGAVSDHTCMAHRLQVRSVKVVQLLNCRVLRGAFERLERHESKGSRAVLRGLGGSNALRLPDPAQRMQVLIVSLESYALALIWGMGFQLP